MSTDLRIKKLRGSGGYVIATLTDEQQSKASIGGPDLFLAPLCRMDTEKISKYFCNMCNEEHEGAPNIQYENPDEEVAPGLILMEKGRYVCKTCSNTIAEYREFKKEEEPTIDTTAVSNVDTNTPSTPQPTEEVQQSTETSIPQQTQPTEEVQQSTETSIPQQTQPTEEVQQSPSLQQPVETQHTTTESASTPISTINGRIVYDENAVKIGTVKQVGVDAANAMVLVVTQNDGTESIIPWSKVKKVGEIVLLGEPDKQTTSAVATDVKTPQDEPGKCKKCGFINKNDSKFCEECGAKLQ